MSFKTLAQLKTLIKDPLDLNEEIFVDDSEITAYINDGIREAEANINTIYEDYFLTTAKIPLVAGTSVYTLPADIYANKIRGFIYDDGSDSYQVAKLRDFKEIPFLEQSWSYQFLLTNSGTTGVELNLYPTPRITSATALTCWYLRNAKQLSDDTDVCDIPEFSSFIVQHGKVRCMEKEGHPLLEMAQRDWERQRTLMVETLSAMIVDADNKITMDVSAYEELS